MQNWIKNQVSKFHDDPTVNESKIIVLLNRFWIFTGKEKAMIWSTFLLALTFFLIISNGENARKWVANLVLKYYDDSKVNESEIIVLLRQIWVYVKKERVLGGEKRKQIWEEEEA